MLSQPTNPSSAPDPSLSQSPLPMSVAQPLLKQFPCPGCGSTLEFDPKAGQLKCPHCGREEQVPDTDTQVEERSYDEFVNANRTQIAALSTTAQEVTCAGCKAQITFEPPDVAGSCPFCGSSIVAQPHSSSPVITPEGLLPFSVSKKAAVNGLQKWLGKRWFAPNGLKKMAQHESIQGVYLPFWTYDCQTYSQYTGERGEYYYVTETYTETNSEGKTETKTRQVRKTRWYSASGQVSRFFDDVLIPAVTTVNVNRLEALEPWDLSKLVPYQPSYLSGFKAQRYQVPLDQGFDLAKGKMEEPIRCDVRRSIGGDEQRIHSVSTDYTSRTFKHILLPVWLLTYRFRNRRFQVMVNAQTGEVLGDRPYSVVKISLAVLAGLTAILGFFGVRMLSSEQIEPLPEPTPTVAPQPLQSSLPSPAPSIAPVPDPRTFTPVPPPTPSGNEPFREAVNAAGRAANMTQEAETEQEWRAIAAQWVEAIRLMQQVPETDENYPIAQQKVTEYRNNLNYARQQLTKLSQ